MALDLQTLTLRELANLALSQLARLLLWPATLRPQDVRRVVAADYGIVVPAAAQQRIIQSADAHHLSIAGEYSIVEAWDYGNAPALPL